MKDKLLVFVSCPGSGEGCSRFCFGFETGGTSVRDVFINTPDALACVRDIVGRAAAAALTRFSREEVLSG